MVAKKLDKRKILWWVTTIGIMMGIFVFSAQPSEESSSISGGIIEMFIKPVLQVFHISYKEIFHTIVRKAAHFMFYGLLGISILNLSQVYQLKKAILIAMVVSLFYACSDEFHQLYVPGRSSELRDVAIDFFGSVVGVFIVTYIKRKKVRERE